MIEEIFKPSSLILIILILLLLFGGSKIRTLGADLGKAYRDWMDAIGKKND